jgi:hypothetical protein
MATVKNYKANGICKALSVNETFSEWWLRLAKKVECEKVNVNVKSRKKAGA